MLQKFGKDGRIGRNQNQSKDSQKNAKKFAENA